MEKCDPWKEVMTGSIYCELYSLLASIGLYSLWRWAVLQDGGVHWMWCWNVQDILPCHMVTNTIQCAAMLRNQTLVLLTIKWLQNGFCSSWFYQKLYVDLTTDHIFSEYYNNILFISDVLFIFAFKINAKTTSNAYFYSY